MIAQEFVGKLPFYFDYKLSTFGWIDDYGQVTLALRGRGVVVHLVNFIN